MERSTTRQYIQLILIAAIGIFLSISAQRYISNNIEQQLLSEYRDVISDISNKFQDEIDYQKSYLSGFQSVIKVKGDELNTEDLNTLIEENLYVLTPVERVVVLDLDRLPGQTAVNPEIILQYPVSAKPQFLSDSDITDHDLTQIINDNTNTHRIIFPQEGDLKHNWESYFGKVLFVIPFPTHKENGQLSINKQIIIVYNMNSLLDDVMESSISEWTDINIFFTNNSDMTYLPIADYSIEGVPKFTFGEHPQRNTSEYQIFLDGIVDFHGHALSALFRPGDPEIFNTYGVVQVAPLLGGLLLTFLIVALQTSLLRRNIVIQKKVKEQTQDLLESRKEMDLLINSVDGVLWKFDLNNNQYTYISEQITHMLGVQTDSILDDAPIFMKMIHPEDLGIVIKTMTHMRTHMNETQNIEFRMIKTDGSEIWVRNIITSISENGIPAHNIGMMLDITRFKEMGTKQQLMEAQLLQAQKLESIGQLAAGVAHEINTPTQFVNDNTHFLKESFEDLITLCNDYNTFMNSVSVEGKTADLKQKIIDTIDEIDLEFLLDEIPECINQSLEGIGRISTIVRAMKDFSHPGTDTKELTDLNSAINSTITVARNEWKYVADLETDFSDDLPMVNVLPGEFSTLR